MARVSTARALLAIQPGGKVVPEPRLGRWVRVRWPMLLLLTAVIPLALVCGRSAVSWIDRPFPGFFVLANGIVPRVGLYDWPGPRAGLPFHARIVGVQGRPVEDPRVVYAQAAAVPIGTPITYEVEYRGERSSLVVPTARFGWLDCGLTVGLFVAFGLAVQLLGFAVYAVRPRHPATAPFLAQTITLGVCGMAAPALYDPALWWLSCITLTAHAIFPAALIHVCSVFPGPHRLVAPRRRWLVLPYAVGVVLAVWSVATFHAPVPTPAPLYACYAYGAVSAVLAFGLLLWALGGTSDTRMRRQVRAVVPLVALALVIGAYGFVHSSGRGALPTNLVAVFAIGGYLGVAWAIARFGLFDIDAVLRRTLVYLTLTLGITGVYAAAVALATLLVPELLQGSAPLFHVGFVVLTAMMFQPIRGNVQRAVDRVFWREEVDYRLTVQELSAALAMLRDLDEILDRLGRTVCRSLGLRAFQAILWSEDQTRVWAWREPRDAMEVLAGGRFDDLRWTFTRQPDQPLEVPVAGTDPGPSLYLPLVVAGQLIGAFGFGRHRSGREFGPQDTELLGTLAAQGAIALENACSYRALQTLAGELEEKVRRRTAELQASNHELAAAYRELKLAQAQLVQSEKMASLGLLVAGVAHEINNPVSFIVGNVEPLRETLHDLATRSANFGDVALDETIARVRRAFEVIARGAERTAGVVNDLRTFSRLGEAQPRPVDVHDGLEVSLRLLRPRWADRITIHRSFGNIPCVDAVPGQLNQVLMNLLANACDAIPDRGNIWIGTAVVGSDVMVTVRDDGVGIPPGDLDRIFDPFFTTKLQGKGTGLGLAISHGIVAQHGGTLVVASTPGQGATFTLRLPTRSEAPAALTG